MSTTDRILRSLFVSLAVGLGWGIRGDFGHALGAMYPGACLGLGFAFVSGQKSMFKWMPLLGGLGALGISTGGLMSYGILHGYAQSDTFINYTYGFFTLVLEGGAWGTFGGAMLGLMLERERPKAEEWASLAATIFAVGWAFQFLVVNILGFHINPPRSDLSIGFTGGVIGQFIWFAFKKKPYGFRGALLGFIGFGFGMAGGRLLGNLVRHQPYPINHWNVMEVSCGLIGGFIFTFGMLGRKFPDPPEDTNFKLLNILSIFFVAGLIPLLHRLDRIPAKTKLPEWTKSLTQYGYQNPDALSHTVFNLLNLVCVLGFAGGGVWWWLYAKNKSRFAPVPVLMFSGVMLLIQNLNALYFWYPRQPGTINMHFVFWIIFGLMVLYALLGKREDIPLPEEEVAPFHWGRWIAGSAAAFALIIFVAGFANGAETMKTANTRWPIWTWNQGPFPGREKPSAPAAPARPPEMSGK